MIDLGTETAPGLLDAVTLSPDELELLVDKLGIAELPVVLNAFSTHDNADARARALEAAEARLTERGLVVDGEVDGTLAERLRVLGRPHWIVALRLYVGETISRLCLARGDEEVVLAARGPDSYVIDGVLGDPTAPIIAALGPADALEFDGLNAPTRQLGEIFDDAGDSRRTAERLADIGIPPRDASTVAGALVHCYAHSEIVGVIYGDGTREQADNHVAVFDTRDGRFVATARPAQDGTRWSALSSGTAARLRRALQDLIADLPVRSGFPGTAGS